MQALRIELLAQYPVYQPPVVTVMSGNRQNSVLEFVHTIPAASVAISILITPFLNNFITRRFALAVR